MTFTAGRSTVSIVNGPTSQAGRPRSRWADGRASLITMIIVSLAGVPFCRHPPARRPEPHMPCDLMGTRARGHGLLCDPSGSRRSVGSRERHRWAEEPVARGLGWLVRACLSRSMVVHSIDVRPNKTGDGGEVLLSELFSLLRLFFFLFLGFPPTLPPSRLTGSNQSAS